MSSRESPRYLVTTYVKPGREGDFEAFMKDVVDAGIRRSNPDQAANVQILRPGAALHGDARPAYVMLFYGDRSLEDWDLEAALVAAYGEDEAARHMAQMEALVQGEQDVLELDERIV